MRGGGSGEGCPAGTPAHGPAPGSRERPLLEADGLGKRFGSRVVLTSAGFSTRPGRITALMGRNGSGKTTMLRIAVGRVRADHGRVLWRGDFLARPSLARMARDGLMYCAQESALTPLFPVVDHLRAYTEVHGGRARVDRVVDELQMGRLLPLTPVDISGGERQRVSLALALIRAPECLLMDEPFAGVAPRDRPLVTRALLGLRGEGCAVVVTGHDVEDLLAVTDEVIWVVGGTSHWLGSPDAACADRRFRRDYLGPRRPGSQPRTSLSPAPPTGSLE